MLKLNRESVIMKQIKGIWCKKVGMTQLFQDNGVLVPVTVLDASGWHIIEVKPATVRIGLVREKLNGQPFSSEWLSSPSNYFQVIREVAHDGVEGLEVGAVLAVQEIVQQGDKVLVSGLTIGRGFQGCVKRHGFRGGRGSHGDKLGRKPGSMGFMRSRGRVIKNWRMAGHMGVEKCTMRGLKVLSTEPQFDTPALMLKGSVPGKTGSLVFVGKI
jgi:large subunit ribosomal protein L3